MFIFKKCSKRLKRTVCVALCLIVLSSLLVIPAGAVDLSGDLSLYNSFTHDTSTRQVSYHYPFQGNNDGVSIGSLMPDSDFGVKPFQISFTTGVPSSGSVGVYFSFYYVAHDEVTLVNPKFDLLDTFYLIAINGDRVQTSFLNSVDVSAFSVPPIDQYTVSRGYALKGRIDHYESIIDSWQYRIRTDSFNPDSYVHFGPGSGNVFLHVPSAVLVFGDASDISNLEGIADGIAAQSQIMSAYYGDIMQLLNDLYSRLGDMQTVQETANAYFAQLIPLVNSINTHTANIHSLLQTQFQLLRTLIATESGNIQDAIEQQTQDLIAYFDTVLSGSTGNMPEKSDDLESSVGNVSDAESDYQSSATERFDQLAGAFSGFSGGTLGGVTLAATLFSRVWSALGEYSIVYSWPLLLGLCLVLIGRLSRLSGGQSSSIKNRGDSDA